MAAVISASANNAQVHTIKQLGNFLVCSNLSFYSKLYENLAHSPQEQAQVP